MAPYLMPAAFLRGKAAARMVGRHDAVHATRS